MALWREDQEFREFTIFRISQHDVNNCQYGRTCTLDVRCWTVVLLMTVVVLLQFVGRRHYQANTCMYLLVLSHLLPAATLFCSKLHVEGVLPTNVSKTNVVGQPSCLCPLQTSRVNKHWAFAVTSDCTGHRHACVHWELVVCDILCWCGEKINSNIFCAKSHHRRSLQ